VALLRARAALHELPLLIRDSITDILMGARVSRRRKHTRLIVIDHLHRIGPAETKYRMPRNEQVRAITESLKTLASSLGIPILLLAQLSRHSERREDHRPVVADIEYAGERDFDNIALLRRPELYLGEKPPPLPDRLDEAKKVEANAAWWRRRDAVRGKAELILAKARMGAVGATWLDFDGPRTRFSASDTADSQQEMF
jgi:replicative DNA helicase